jgi:hypothetical protein
MTCSGRQSREKERRTQVRISADRKVGCRVPASPVDAVLSDLSPEGCRIWMQTHQSVQPGSTIVVHLGDEKDVACRVVWIEGDNISLRFYEPLNIRAIARAPSKPEPDEPLKADSHAKRRLI